MPSGTKGPPDPLTQEVAAILRERLARLRMSQTELARKAGISQPMVNRMLNGAKAMDLDQLYAMCYVLGLDMVEVAKTAQTVVKRAASGSRIRKELIERFLDDVGLNGTETDR